MHNGMDMSLATQTVDDEAASIPLPRMTRFSILTFNMQFGQTWDDQNPDGAPVDLERSIEALRELDADVVLLQEVEQVDTERGQIDPPPNFSRIREALPQYDSFFSYPAKDERELPFGYGLAILSKTPLTHHEKIDLPAPELSFEFEGEKTVPTDRLLIGARTKLGGQEVQILNTHLQAFFVIHYSSDDHMGQRNRVAEVLSNSALPTLLGGDFNAAPGEGTVEQLEATGFRTVQKDVITWKRLPYVLDHLFYNHGLHLEQHEVIDTDAADHKIIKAVFSLPEAD